MKLPTALAASLILLSASAHCGQRDRAPDENWASHGLDSKEQRFSQLAQINHRSVARLGLAWSLDLPGENALPATPLAVDGVLYFSGGLAKVYAVDASTGTLLWTYDPGWHQDPASGGSSPREARRIYGNNRGVAYWNAKVYVATKDGRLIALDAKSGRPVWTSTFLLPNTNATSSGAPRTFAGKVIIGNSGAETGARGYVSTFDAETGHLLWRFFTVPGDPAKGFEDAAQAMAATTWSGQWWKYGGGGTPWNAITYDEELHQIYIGTGNAAPWNGKFRSTHRQDNLFVASVVALDPDTGQYRWHYQYNPHEEWDWKATADIVLTDLRIDGKVRKVLMQAPSNGFFYVIDRHTGKVLSAEKIGKVTWADRIDLNAGRPIERPGIHYEDAPIVIYPSAWGAHNWQAMSYNSKAGLVYIPYMQRGMKIGRSAEAEDDVRAEPSKILIRVGVSMQAYRDDSDPRDGKGSLLAWDPVRQRVRWRVDHPTFFNAGTMTTAGNLVFQGTSAGWFYAFRADNGQRVWSFDAKLGITAPAITYSTRGRQFVALLVGYGAGASEGGVEMQQGWKYGRQPRRLLAFALDGKANLPETPPADFSVNALDDPSMKLDAARIQRGAALYGRAVCTACHGASVEASGGAPDLRESAIAFNLPAFKALLRGASLVSRGMPQFDDLSDDEIEDLYHYIRAKARAARSQAART